MTAMVIDTYQMPNEMRSPTRVLVRKGLGLSFVLTMSLGALSAQDQKHHESQTVNQQRCAFPVPQDIFSQAIPKTRVCSGCGGDFDQAAFASKGRGRKSSLCKECENKKRRLAYKPKSITQDWDNLIIRTVPVEDCADRITPLIWEMIVALGFVDAKTDEEQSLDALLSRRNSLDIFLDEVEYEEGSDSGQSVHG